MNLPLVTLRKVLVTDAPDLAILHADPDIQKWLGGPTTVERCEGLIHAWNMKMRDEESWYYSLLNTDGHFVGFCTIIPEEEEAGEYHMTIGVSPRVRRFRYGEAAVSETITLAKQQPKVKFLVALVEDENKMSHKLMSKFDPNPTSKLVERFFPERTIKEWTFKLF
jgi:RimJ/RimL family protein N-acetyltransferase